MATLKPIDAGLVFRLAKIGCTQTEIAEIVGCDPATICKRFSNEFGLGKAKMKSSLRRMQFRAAARGSATMLIHLGKVHLGQTDRLDVTTNGGALKPDLVDITTIILNVLKDDPAKRLEVARALFVNGQAVEGTDEFEVDDEAVNEAGDRA